MKSSKIAAAIAAVAALPIVLGGAPAQAATHSTKVFAHRYAYNAQVQCQNYQTDLRRAGYLVTTPCTYVPWGNQHGFAVTWRH